MYVSRPQPTPFDVHFWVGALKIQQFVILSSASLQGTVSVFEIYRRVEPHAAISLADYENA
jgi:hypothetical protein